MGLEPTQRLLQRVSLGIRFEVGHIATLSPPHQPPVSYSRIYQKNWKTSGDDVTKFRAEYANKLIQVLDTALPFVKYESRLLGELNAFQVKELYGAGASRRFDMMRPDIPADLMTCIAKFVEPAIDKFQGHDTGTIGNGIAAAFGGLVNVNVEYIVTSLMKAASVLGSRRAVDLFVDWVNGEPLKYTSTALMVGVSIDRPTSISEGIELSRLPMSGPLVRDLPYGLSDMEGEPRFLGRVIMRVEESATPVFYAMPDDHKISLVRFYWGRECFDGQFPLDAYCEALSLIANHHINWQHSWKDPGNAHPFVVGSGYTSRADAHAWPKTKTITQNDLQKALKLYWLRDKYGKDKSLEIAVERWIRCKGQARDVRDSFIELRIALEALYLPGMSGELSYRLAHRGAWHLGKDVDERKKLYATLRSFYTRASNIVHAGKKRVTPKHHELLAKAQTICRDGILKRLKDGPEQDWDSVVLGAVSRGKKPTCRG